MCVFFISTRCQVRLTPLSCAKLFFSFFLFLEPELALDYDNEEEFGDNTIEYLTATWENHFQPVAVLLLDRIERHHSNLEPLDSPPG